MYWRLIAPGQNMTQSLDWTEFDSANGQLALNELERTSPAHVNAIRKLLKQGANEREIKARFRVAFPTWEGHLNYIGLAVRYLQGAE
jgi:hypothetical protein